MKDAAAVWDYLESIPGFNEDLRQAEEDLDAGRGIRYEVKGRSLRRVVTSRPRPRHPGRPALAPGIPVSVGQDSAGRAGLEAGTGAPLP